MSTNDVSNSLSLRDAYPATPGASTPQSGGSTAAQETSTQGAVDKGSPVLANAAYTGMQGSPVHFWIALVVLLFGGMWLATKYEGGGTYANIKFSVYNILAIVLLGIAGGAIAKVIMTRWPLPGVSTIVLAS